MLRLLDFHGLRDKSKSRSPFPSFTSKARGQGVAAVGVQGKGNREGHDKGKGIDEQSRHHDTTTDIPNMGKSNKFDCTNRRNEGVDLGKSIGDAARKELEKTKKDAVRQAGRARKASAGSLTGGENDIAGVHLIDLVAPSKALTDDGVAAMVEGLHAAMKAGTSDASVTLEGLNLRDNQLTTKALATLAPVIHLAQNELKTIVLSDNNITVTSDAEAKEWEIFLTAFRSCKTLRRLDLSGNCELGSRALEIFCKVHCNEPHIDPIALGGDRSVYTLDETQESDDNKSLTAYDDESGFDPMTLGTMLRRRCGLRSIPYISLQNVGINDTGALWLSYVLEDHYFPNQLVNEINAAPATSSVDAYRQGAVEGGIDWSGHKGTLGKDGFLLLTKTEAARKQTTNTDALSSTAGSSMTTSIKSLQPRRHSRASLGDRRLSIRSIHTDDGGEHELSEVESIRKHIQRHIIDNRGVNSVGLWNAALQVIAASRKLAYIAPPDSRRSCFIEPRLSISPHVEDVSPKSKEQRLDSVFDAGAHVPTTVEGLPSADEAPSSPTATMTRNTIKSYVATLAEMTSPDRAETAITEVTNTPGTPKRMFVAHRKGAFSEGSDLHTLSERLSSVQMEDAAARDRDPERFIKWQEENAAPQSYRHTHLACHLPQSPFERILTFALATPGDMADWGLGKEAEVVSAQDGEQVHWPSRDLLSDKQLRAAYDWGQDRDSLVQERKWAGMAESTQRFMLLDAIGCLAYEA